MDAFFALSIMRDIINGLTLIHNTSWLGYHGKLSSRNCVVDDRWVVKISDYGLQKLVDNYKKRKTGKKKWKYFWSKTEELFRSFMDSTRTSSGYRQTSIETGRHLQPCHYLFRSPYEKDALGSRKLWNGCRRFVCVQSHFMEFVEIVYRLKKAGRQEFRPTLELNDTDGNSSLILLIKDCWAENPNNRPNAEQIKSLIRGMNQNR